MKVLIFGVLLVGCGNDSGPIAITSLGNQLGKATCTKLFECCTQPEIAMQLGKDLSTPYMAPTALVRSAVPPPIVVMAPMGMMAGCPRCGSPMGQHMKGIYIALAILLFPLGLLFLLAEKRRTCMNVSCQFSIG